MRVFPTVAMVLCGCASGSHTDADRLQQIMGRNDHHKLEIQYRTHEPDARIEGHLLAIEEDLRRLRGLRPYAPQANAILHSKADEAVSTLRRLRSAPWTRDTVVPNWKTLEITCTSCHEAFEWP